MVYNHKEMLEKYKTNYQIKLALNKGDIYKIENGIYSDEKIPNEMEVITKKYPNAIFTMDNAFYLYDLTDVIPRKYYLAVQENRKKIIHPKIETVSMSKSFFDIGKTEVSTHGAKIAVYDKERMLIELVRNKKQIPYDYYKEILNNFREQVDSLDIRKIQKYLKSFKNSNSISRIIRTEVY